MAENGSNVRFPAAYKRLQLAQGSRITGVMIALDAPISETVRWPAETRTSAVVWPGADI